MDRQLTAFFSPVPASAPNPPMAMGGGHSQTRKITIPTLIVPPTHSINVDVARYDPIEPGVLSGHSNMATKRKPSSTFPILPPLTEDEVVNTLERLCIMSFFLPITIPLATSHGMGGLGSDRPAFAESSLTIDPHEDWSGPDGDGGLHNMVDLDFKKELCHRPHGLLGFCSVLLWIIQETALDSAMLKGKVDRLYAIVANM